MIRLSAFADEISQNPVEQVDVLSQNGIKFIEFRAIHGTNVLDLSESQHADYRGIQPPHISRTGRNECFPKTALALLPEHPAN